MQKLIAALGENIRASGTGKWVARCPVHDDKDFAMSISEGKNGGVVANCYGCGANGLDLYRTMGIDLDELFGGKNDSYAPAKAVKQVEDDKWFCAVFEADEKAGRLIAWVDRKTYKIAKARYIGLTAKYGII